MKKPKTLDIAKRLADGQKLAAAICASVVDPYSQNVLINPLHPDAKGITVSKIEPFTYDERLRADWRKK